MAAPTGKQSAGDAIADRRRDLENDGDWRQRLTAFPRDLIAARCRIRERITKWIAGVILGELAITWVLPVAADDSGISRSWHWREP